MSQPLEKPKATKKISTLEVFTIEQPIELIQTKDSSGKISQHWRMATFYFTTHDSPVTVNGHQHVPLSYFDQVKWDDVVAE